MTSPTDTLSSAYMTASLQLPDGTAVPVLVRRVPRGDGSTGMIVVDDAMIAFEQRFANTDFVPADQAPVTTDAVVKNRETLRNEVSTRIKLMSADMVQFVGDPDRIIAQKALDPERLSHLKAHPSSATMARRICTAMGGKWAEVAAFIPNFYPDSNHRG
jgi:hypothetical protein